MSLDLAKGAFVGVIDHINKKEVMPTNRETMESMRCRSDFWTASSHDVRDIKNASQAADKLDAFFNGRGDSQLVELWRHYRESFDKCVVVATTMEHHGC
jgi:hypothetical protein